MALQAPFLRRVERPAFRTALEKRALGPLDRPAFHGPAAERFARVARVVDGRVRRATPTGIRAEVGRLTWRVLRPWIALAMVTGTVLAFVPSAPGYVLLLGLAGSGALALWQRTRD